MEVAAVVVTPILEGLTKKLGSAIWKELGLLWGVKADLKKLERLFSKISAVLEDAEKRSIREQATREWLKDLKDAAFDADDVLDEFEFEATWRMNVHNTVTGKVRRFFSSRNSIIFRFKMAHKIEAIIRKFNEIAEEKKKFGLAERDIPVRQLERETFSLMNETEIFGREGDKERVMEWLTDRDTNKDVSVLPIIGLGGVGKTTLAQLVFNDEKVKKHFEIQIWVCVGEVFDVKDIVKAILENMKVQCPTSRLEDMQRSLREKLMDKRYLLVLDDVWNDDASKWETLRLLLRGQTQGHKIIVTTRIQKVAEIMGTVPSPYKLEVLSDDDCWTLFKQRAFRVGREEDNPILVQIGKEIVEKCGGLPLAAKSLGSLMATKREEAEWLAIKDSELWRSDEGREGILPALQLSYDHLPPQLKKCFAYCSVFPEDREIDKLTLIQLWVAEGLVTSKDGMHAEDIGDRYFNILLGISFFQDEEKDDFGDIISCKVHDLVRNLACFVAKDESAIVDAGRDVSFPSDQCRYLSVIGHDDPVPSSTIVKFSQETRKLRSLIMWTGIMEPVPWDAVRNLTLLRVLDLRGSGITEIPSIVGKFKHLKFLNLSGTEIESLPGSITNLYSLQTLKLRRCQRLLKLPGGIKKLSNLRHLDISYCRRLTGMPRGLGRLTNLLTLPMFVIGNEPDHGTLAELKHLNQIRGELVIRGLDKEDAAEANLSSKTGLRSLCLGGPKSVGILENLQPPRNLNKLEIWSYDGNTWPTWFTQLDLSSSYSNLVELGLDGLDRCESLPPLGQLPFLKRLDIALMNTIKKIGAEFYGESGTFPSLKSMRLRGAPQLEEWSVPSNGVLFPSLDALTILGCPKLTIQPCLPSSIVELVIYCNNEELLAAGGCLRGLSRLRELRISSMDASETSWKGLQNLTALEKLEIILCEDLICLPVGVLQHHFSTLRTLELKSNASLESLGGGGGGGGGGESEQQPPPLFSSLRHLIIDGCRNLTALPEWLRSLQSLEELKILACPDLERRCQKGTGEDWRKIDHIPNVDIRLR